MKTITDGPMSATGASHNLLPVFSSGTKPWLARDVLHSQTNCLLTFSEFVLPERLEVSGDRVLTENFRCKSKKERR